MSSTIEQLHSVRLQLGNIRQVLEVISLRTESAPIPMFAPLAMSSELEPVALFPVTVEPTKLNNFIVGLSEEYFVEMSAKEVEHRLNEKIKKLEITEQTLSDKLKNESSQAQNELEGNVRNISEFISEEEYEQMQKKKRPTEKTKEVDYNKEREYIQKLAALEHELESRGKLEYFEKVVQTEELSEIPESEFANLPAVKSTIVERKKEKKVEPTKEKGGIVERKKENKLETGDKLVENTPKRVSLFKQRQQK